MGCRIRTGCPRMPKQGPCGDRPINLFFGSSISNYWPRETSPQESSLLLGSRKFASSIVPRGPGNSTPTLTDLGAPPGCPAMSELQKAWARSRLGPAPATELQFPDDALETDEEADVVLELPEHADDDSSSASSASSTGTIVPSPSQKLFARPLGCVLPARVLQPYLRTDGCIAC